MDMSLFDIVFRMISIFAVCLVISGIAAVAYTLRTYAKFEDPENAMKYYRESCTNMLSHRILRSIILIAAAVFYGYVIFTRNNFEEMADRRLYCIATVIIAIAADVHIFSNAGDFAARIRLLHHIRDTYKISEGVISNWFVDLDDDDYPEELEFNIIDGKVMRRFVINLKFNTIREGVPVDKTEEE